MTTETVDFETAWQEWRAQREARLRDPHGFLAITGLHWLSDEPQRFDDVPGAWHAGPGGVVVTLGPDEELAADGTPVTGTHVIGPVDTAGVTGTFGDAVVEIADRFGTPVLRPRHPDAPTLRRYAGTPAYDPDPRWALTARFEAYDEPRPLPVGSVIEGMETVYAAVGEVSFDLPAHAGGAPQRLVAFDGGDDGSLWLLFTDETSGVTTYAALRQLAVPAPDEDGTAVLDFNRAANMPCAYTDFATCPLPPRGNHVAAAVEAGERKVR